MPSVFTLFGELKADTASFEAALRAADARLKATEREIARTEERARGLGQTSAVTARHYQKLTEQVAQNRAELVRSATAYAHNAISLKQMGSAIDSTGRNVGNMTSRLRDANARLSDFSTRSANIVGKLREAGDGMRSFGQSVTIGVTLPLIGLGKVALDQAAGIDAWRNRLQAAAGSTDAANKKFKELFALAQSSPGVMMEFAVSTYALLKPMKLAEDTIDRFTKALGRIKLQRPETDLSTFTDNLRQIFESGDQQDIKQAFENFPRFGEILQKAFDLKSTGRKDVGDEIDALIAKGLTFEQFMSKIADTINSDPSLSRLEETIGTRMAKLKERMFLALEPLGRGIASILEQIVPPLVAFIERMSAAFTALGPTMQTIVIAFAGIAAAAGPVIIAIGGIVAAVSAIAASASTIGVVLLAIAGLGIQLGALVGVAAVWYEAWKANFGGIRDLVTVVATAVEQAWADAMTKVTELTSTVTAEIAAFWAENGEDIKKAAQSVSDFIKKTWQAIVSIWEKHGDSIRTVTDAIWSLVRNSVLTGLRLIMDAVRLTAALINGEWSKAGSALLSIIGTFMAATRSLVFNGLKALVLVVKLALQAIWDLRNWVFAQAVELGANIWKGMVRGIASGVGWVAEAAINLAKSAIDAAKGPQGVDTQSPSKKFFKIGQDVGRGFALGIGSQQVAVLEAMINMVTPKGVEKAIKERLKELQKTLAESLTEGIALSEGYRQSIGFDIALEKADRMKSVLTDLKAIRIDLSTNLDRPLILGPESERELGRLTKIKDTLDEMVDAWQESISLSGDESTLTRFLNLFSNPEATKAIEKRATALGLQVDMFKKLISLSSAFREKFEEDPSVFGQGSGRDQNAGPLESGLGSQVIIEANPFERIMDLLNPIPTLKPMWDDFWATMLERIEYFKSTLPSVKEALGENLIGSLDSLASGLANTLTTMHKSWGDFFRSIGQNFAQMAQQIASEMIRLIILQSLLKLFGGSLGGLGGGAGAGAAATGPSQGLTFADGGAVHGPGTGTSDSILARLSNGEFVMRAEAVKKWGVGFFERLNNLSFQPPTMAFAGGGFVGSGGSSSVYNNQRSSSDTYIINVNGGSNPQQTAQQIRRELMMAARRDEIRNK